jgi:hypothetical protein
MAKPQTKVPNSIDIHKASPLDPSLPSSYTTNMRARRTRWATPAK